MNKLLLQSFYLLQRAEMQNIIRFLLILCVFICPGYVLAADSLLVISPDKDYFHDAMTGLEQSLEGEYILAHQAYTDSLTALQIEERMIITKPRLVICMDNGSSKLFQQYQEYRLKPGAPVIPSIHMLGVFLSPIVKNIKNAALIHYEVPFDTTVVLFNQLVNNKIKSLGVIYQPFMKEFVDLCSKRCQNAGIEVVDMLLPEDTKKTTIALGMELKAKLTVGRVDALWVPNDMFLINKETLQSIWNPILKKNRVPIFVGAEVLLNPELNFGTFAVLPNHVELGKQAGALVFEIAKNNWLVSDNIKASFPSNLHTAINVPQAVKHFSLKKDALANVDRWIQK